MKKLFKTILVEGLLLLLPVMMSAQEKTQSYYNTHESEILPDAQEAFREGNYDRTVQLCIWHYVIVGDRTAEPLRNKAEQCALLSKEMRELQSKGETETAIEKANAILALNPDDEAAKALLPVEEPEPVIEIDTLNVIQPIDTVATTTEAIESNPLVQIEEPEDDLSQEQWHGWDTNQVDLGESTPLPDGDNPHTKFLIKGGASILDLKQAGETASLNAEIGFYDIGGSRIGAEIGYCPGMFSSEASLYVAEAALVIRAFKGSYPKVGVGGFYSSYPEKGGNTTKGLCGILGWTFIIGEHFCIEIGANYYPTINILGKEIVGISGGSYDFPTKINILSGGISPRVCVGFVF